MLGYSHGVWMPSSPDTILRLMHRHPPQRSYATCAWHRRLSLASWNHSHQSGTSTTDGPSSGPNVQDGFGMAPHSSRRRDCRPQGCSTEYARAITEGVPDDIQVADRWYLFHNLRQVLVRYLTSARSRLNQFPGSVAFPGENRVSLQRRSRAERAASEATRERRHARYMEVLRPHFQEGLNAQ